jgi:ketosteroid isomerase-like protein
MAGEHLQTMREAHASFNRGDAAWAERLATEDVEWGTTATFPGMEPVYHGAAGVAEWMRVVLSAWQEFEVSLDEVIGETDDAVAIVERIWGRGRGSGAEGEMNVYAVYRFTAEGKVATRQAFTTREDALDAL